MHPHRRRHARKVEKTAKDAYRALIKFIEEQKAEEHGHHDADALDEGEECRREYSPPVLARKS